MKMKISSSTFAFLSFETFKERFCIDMNLQLLCMHILCVTLCILDFYGLFSKAQPRATAAEASEKFLPPRKFLQFVVNNEKKFRDFFEYFPRSRCLQCNSLIFQQSHFPGESARRTRYVESSSPEKLKSLLVLRQRRSRRFFLSSPSRRSSEVAVRCSLQILQFFMRHPRVQDKKLNVKKGKKNGGNFFGLYAWTKRDQVYWSTLSIHQALRCLARFIDKSDQILATPLRFLIGKKQMISATKIMSRVV